MTLDLLPSMLADILRHTPIWVWAVLAGLVRLGRWQMRDREVSRLRVVVLPLAMLAWSLASAASLFGAQAGVAGAWALGVIVALGIGHLLPLRPTDGRLILRGSLWPLAGMLAIFALRYAANVALAIQPSLAAGAMGPTMSLLLGALSGGFAARAVRSLRAAGGLFPSASLAR